MTPPAPDPERRYRRRLLPLALLAVAAVKLALLLALGPTRFEDSALYLRIGQWVLDTPGWWRAGEWTAASTPDLLFRPYGYPLLIAAARTLAGAQAPWLLVLLQSAASLGVLALFGRVLPRLVASVPLRLGLVLLCGLSDFLLFDLAILSDSLHASLMLAALLPIVARLADGADGPAPGARFAVAVGLAWALAMTLRDTAWYHAVLPLGGLLLLGAVRRLGPAATGRLALLAAGPILACYLGVTGWNQLRTGHPFFSLTGGINWLWPSVNLRDRGLADPFACADPVCAAARALPVEHGMAAVQNLATAIANREETDPLAFGRLTFAHFLATVRAHPLAYAATVAANLNYGALAHLSFDPLFNLNEALRLHQAGGQRWIGAAREQWLAVRQGRLDHLPALLLQSLLEVAALLGFTIALVGAPLLAARRWRSEPGPAAAALFCWAGGTLFLLSYALLHLETRHALPTVPLWLALFGYAAQRILARARCATPA